VRQAARKGETDLIVKDWFADYPDGENFLYPLLHSASSNGGPNVSYYSNPDFDRLVERARSEPNDPRRAALYRQADSLAFVEAPMVFLFFSNELLAVQPWVGGFQVPVIFNGQRWEKVSLGTGNKGHGTEGGTRE
jgi:ABC-type oligopeptide transport system substrate-binding subunit